VAQVKEIRHLHQSTLVSSREENANLMQECVARGLKFVPKSVCRYLPVTLCDSQPETPTDYRTVDNHQLDGAGL
jgi:hypothetical protein